jgi:hypothetical protein
MKHAHIYVITDIVAKERVYDKTTEIELNDECYCLRCGQTGIFKTYEFLSSDEEFEFDEENYPCICDKDLTNAIYKKIIQKYPNIDKKTLLKYFKASLYNIRNKEKSEAVVKKRIKRLGLYPGFSKWDKDSVIHHISKTI